MGFQHAGGVPDELVLGQPTLRFALRAELQGGLRDAHFAVVLRGADDEVVGKLVGVGEGEVDLFAGEDMEARLVEGELARDGVDEDVADVAGGGLGNLAAGRTFREDPDVAEADRVAVVLEVEWTERALLPERGGGGGLGNLDVVLHEDAVEVDRHAGIGGFLALGIKARGGEVDVVGLPGERWEAHVELWLRGTVNAAGVAFVEIGTEGIEDLYLVAALQVDPAVAAALSTFERTVGGAEFDVEMMVAEGEVANVAFAKVAFVVDPGVLEGAGVEPVVEVDGIDGGLLPERLALALDLLQLALAFGVTDDSVLKRPRFVSFAKDYFAILTRAAVAAQGEAAAGAGEAPFVEPGLELAVAQGDDLHTSVLAIDLAGILALIEEIRIELLGRFRGEEGLLVFWVDPRIRESLC